MKIKLFCLPNLVLITLLSLSATTVSASVNIAPPSLNDPYHLGKVTYHKKLACGTCPLAETTLDSKTAMEFIPTLNTDEELIALLSKKERAAVAFYLKRFFAPRQ